MIELEGLRPSSPKQPGRHLRIEQKMLVVRSGR